MYDFQFNKDAGVQEDACNRKWHASGIDPNGDLTPYDYFRLLWDDEVEETLVRMVNEYGAMRKQQNMPAKRRSLIARWEDTNKSEMRKFVAVVIQMGIDKRPSINKYWSGSAQYSTPWFRSMFARERFELLYHTSMLHASELNAEKIQKILPFLNTLVRNFQEVFYPFRNVSIDEMVVGFKLKGRTKYISSTTQGSLVSFI